MNFKTFSTILSFIVAWVAFPNFAMAQESLAQRLQGKNTLKEIMDVVDAYYQKETADHDLPAEEESEESQYLHWKRWEWYMSSHLGPRGEFVNISEKLMAGLQEKEKMEVPQDRNINSHWTFVGPSVSSPYGQGSLNGIGRVDRITFHPTNPNIIFICTPAGGLWNTLNGGTNWNNLTDYLPAVGISGFVISYANTDDQYLLTGDGDSNIPNGLIFNMGYLRPSIGVLKSTDGGVSWHQTGEFPQINGPYVGYKLIQNPNDPQILIAATSNGVYRTTNGGTTWNRELSLPTYDVEYKPGDGTRVYASVLGDFWLSTNSGDGWTSNSTYDFNPNTCNGTGGRIQIGVSPTDANVVYLFSGPKTGIGSYCGVWKSNDAGLSFTRQGTTPNILGSSDVGQDSVDQSEYDLAFAVSPFAATSIIAAGCTVWRSANSGTTWTHCTSYGEGGNFPYIHPDVHDLAYNPLNSWLYAATDGGLYRSQDFGISWTNLSNNIEASQIYRLAGWDGNLNKLLCGFQDNGTKYRNANSSTFNHINGGDGFDIVFNPNTGEPAYGTVNDFYSIYSNDGANVSNYLYLKGFFFKTLAIHNTDPDTVILGSYNIFRSVNGAQNWNQYSGSGSWTMTSCPSNNLRFYSAGGNDFQPGSGALYFSADIGITWTAKSGNPGFPSAANFTKITDIAVKPNTSGTVWACFGGFNSTYKVVMSTNTGDTWTNMTANLPNVPVNCLAIDNNGNAYAGTDIGVFYRSTSMSNWMPWSNALPNAVVTDLVIYDDGTNKWLRAATFGRGVWQASLAGTCDAAVVVTGNIKGMRHYEASTSVTSSAFIQGGIGTFVSYKSGNYITLNEGFNVVDDSEFLGFINPCGIGGIPSAQDNFPINREDPNSSIILLRRMWDPHDGLPYGAIDIIEQDVAHAHVKIKLKDGGDVQIVAARPVQEKLATLYNGHEKPGTHHLDLDLSNLPREFHYLLLFYEGKLIHFQELNLSNN